MLVQIIKIRIGPLSQLTLCQLKMWAKMLKAVREPLLGRESSTTPDVERAEWKPLVSRHRTVKPEVPLSEKL